MYFDAARHCAALRGFRVIVGVRLDREPMEYYLGYESPSARRADYTGVRKMLTGHLEELRLQTAALSAILASDDPEIAERYLQDGVQIQVSEVILRPKMGCEDVLPAIGEFLRKR